MHFHLPKPLHGWREFTGEVGIIVIGVLIALIGEATFEQWNWHRKVEAATRAMDEEIKASLLNTLEADRLAKCQDAQWDFIQQKLVEKDWSFTKLPVQWSLTDRHYFSDDAFTSAVASQVSEHLSQKQLQAYSGVYMQIRKIHQEQDDGWKADPVFAMLDIRELPKSDAIQFAELSALATIRQSLSAIRDQGTNLRKDALGDLGLRVTQGDLERNSGLNEAIRKCEAAAGAARKLQAAR
jgi:hypothetical protein